MPNLNKRPAIDIPDTNPNLAKRNCRTAEPPLLELQLSQIQSALSAATTLLATLANLATTLAVSNHATTPSTIPASSLAMIPSTIPEMTPTTNPAMILATPALPAALATTPMQMDGVLADCDISAVIDLTTPETTPATNPPMIVATPPETTPATHPAMILATPARAPSLATAPEPSPLKRRNSLRRQDRRSPLTNQDGLVILSKSTFLTKLRLEWRYLLDPTQMLNLCFFFERPISHEAYHEANANSRLVGLGPFSPTRWKHMAEIHCLFPSDVGHIYIAERADLPHYQEVFSKFLAALDSYHDRMPVYLYMKGQDYSNHFMLVRNSEKSVIPFMDRIDWMATHLSSCNSKTKAGKTSAIGKKRQNNFVDTGYCSAVSLSRHGTFDGVSEPRMKPGTMENSAVVNGYVVLSDFIEQTPVKWTAENKRLFHDADNLDRHERFAAKIHKRNILESQRISSTHLNSICGCHDDHHNSSHKSCRAVVGISKIMHVDGKDVRIGINAQGRKSIDDCLSRSNKYRPLLETVLSVYERMPDNRKVVSKTLLQGQDGGGIAGFHCLRNPCNMDPMSFCQPFLHYLTLLVEHFGLTFPETVGVVAAIEILPNTAYFFCAAAEALLAMVPSDLNRCHRGFAFGYLLAKLLLYFRRSKLDRTPGTRFNIYWEPELPSGKDWEDRCTLKTQACLRFHAAFATLVHKKRRAIQYKKLRKHFCSTTPNCDLLVTNHVLCICSCLGLLPSWVRGEVEVASSNRYMQWFLSRFKLPATADSMEQITETVRHALSTRYQIPFSRRKVENVLCKVYRTRSGSHSDKKFCDLVFPGQMLFTCEGDRLRVSFPSNAAAEDTLVELYLVQQWAFDNTLLSVEDIIGKLGISDKGVPTNKEASDWLVPSALMFGRAKTKLDFDIGHQVPVSCPAFLRKSLRMISRSLGG